MTTPSRKAKQGLKALQIAVEKALERKKRLGQYAVVWSDGKPAYIGENAPQEPVAAVETNSNEAPEEQ